MINIYAQTFMNATRTGEVPLRDLPAQIKTKRRRWFTRNPATPVDLKNL